MDVVTDAVYIEHVKLCMLNMILLSGSSVCQYTFIISIHYYKVIYSYINLY